MNLSSFAGMVTGLVLAPACSAFITTAATAGGHDHYSSCMEFYATHGVTLYNPWLEQYKGVTITEGCQIWEREAHKNGLPLPLFPPRGM